jgi:hypothetical protein
MANRTLDLTIPHKLTRDEVRARLAEQITKFEGGNAFAGIAAAEHHWTGDRLDFTFKAMGQQARGWLDIHDSDVKLSIELPWMLAMLADKLRPQVEAEGRKLLEKK